MMKKKYFIPIAIFFLCIANGLSPQLLQATKKVSRKSLIKKLAPKYKEWLDLVHYIITPTEKDVFFKLTNNRNRDTVINLFWNLRDPTKGTPQNEFKEEHIKRFQYANRYFKYGSPLPGWKTDRGRIYILLGPPLNKNEIPSKNYLYPTEIWEYFGRGKADLPTLFRIVFYKRYSSGDYKLYIPAIDGPYSLLREEIGKIDPTDYYSIYNRIMEIEPAVAEICLSLIPGEVSNNYSPSLYGPILISKIYDLPKKKINATYAKNFLNYKGVVETSVTTNYINIKSAVYTFKNPILGLNFIHLAILPERISVDYSEERDQYYFNLNLMVILKKGEDVILQYDKNFSLYYTKEELDEKLSNGIIITDYFPVIEGKFKLVMILQNSVNKELSYSEKKINITPVDSSLPRIFGPIISYQINKEERAVYSSFNILGNNIKIDPKQTFGLRDSISAFFYVEKGSKNKPFHIELEVESEDEKRPYFKKYSLEFPEGKKVWCFTKNLGDLKYSDYSLKIMLKDEKEIILDLKTNIFQVSPISYIPHPPLASKILKKENRFYFYLSIASQYQKIKEYSKAEAYYEKSLQMNSTFSAIVKNYASFLLERKKYNKMLLVIENLKGQEKEAFDYYALKGRGLYYKQDYKAALDALLAANKIYDSDVSVLNTLGFSFIRTGQKEEAVKALSASLKIIQHQKKIEKILQQLKNDIKNDKTK